MKQYLVAVAFAGALFVSCWSVKAESRDDQKSGQPIASDAAGRGGEASKETKEGMKMKEQKSGEWTPGLNESEKETLFAIAKDTLEWCVKGGKGDFSFDKYTITEKMKKDTATFVTLKIQGMLRGCIGSLAPVEPLYKSVHNNAVNAAIHDYRFRPVTAGELGKIDIHISLLSPIVDIASLEEFKLGEHGIIMEKGPYRAVYLPEVAIEQKWTKDETLESLSEKAGLPGDAWKKGAKFKVFSSVVLSKE
jgi:AmmeMemoRadiSam system protein A